MRGGACSPPARPARRPVRLLATLILALSVTLTTGCPDAGAELDRIQSDLQQSKEQLADAVYRMKNVPLDCDTILTARDLGISFGDGESLPAT